MDAVSRLHELVRPFLRREAAHKPDKGSLQRHAKSFAEGSPAALRREPLCIDPVRDEGDSVRWDPCREGLGVGVLADHDQVAVGEPADADLLRPQGPTVNGRNGRRVGQAPGDAGQCMGIEQMGVDHVDAMPADQLDRQLNRAPDWVVLNGCDIDLEPEPAQRGGERAFVGAQTGDLEFVAWQLRNQIGDVGFHPANDGVAEDLQELEGLRTTGSTGNSVATAHSACHDVSFAWDRSWGASEAISMTPLGYWKTLLLKPSVQSRAALRATSGLSPAVSAGGPQACTDPPLWAVPVRAGPGARRATARSAGTRWPTRPGRWPARVGWARPPCWGHAPPKTLRPRPGHSAGSDRLGR